MVVLDCDGISLIQKRVNMKRVNGVMAASIVSMMLYGCSQKEFNNLRLENQQLKSEMASLKQEIEQLKETADYHYRQGMDLISSKNFEEAKVEFETIIEKYPNSSLTVSAKQQLTKINGAIAKIEVQRRIEEKRLEAEKIKETKEKGLVLDLVNYSHTLTSEYAGYLVIIPCRFTGVSNNQITVMHPTGTYTMGFFLKNENQEIELSKLPYGTPVNLKIKDRIVVGW